MVSFTAYNGPPKYSICDGEIGDPEEVKFVISPRYGHTVSSKGGDAIRKKYPSGGKYLGFPETKEGRGVFGRIHSA